MIAYKLFRVKKSGALGSLFIDKKLNYEIGITYYAECHPTKGYSIRTGFHCCSKPHAPHLSLKNRAWYIVDIEDYKELIRPESQGGLWYIANQMKLLELYND
jgi:hypothetical protein